MALSEPILNCMYFNTGNLATYQTILLYSLIVMFCKLSVSYGRPM